MTISLAGCDHWRRPKASNYCKKSTFVTHHRNFPPLFRSDTDYTPSGDELTYSPFTSTDDTSTTTTLTLMTNTTYSSDMNDHSIESSTTYLGLFKDDSDINIFSDDSHSDNTNISVLAYKPFEDS
jgi:hypothetical protein